jgi:hypothetical protein
MPQSACLVSAMTRVILIPDGETAGRFSPESNGGLDILSEAGLNTCLRSTAPSLNNTLRVGAACLRKLGENKQADEWEQRASREDQASGTIAP